MNKWIYRSPIPVLAALLLVLGTVAPAAALGATSSEMPVHFFRSADCTGEVVEISGTVHLLAQTQPDGSLIGHFNYQNVRGVGLTSGAVYRVSAVDHFWLAAPFPSSIQSERSFHLISQGAASNLLVRVLYHITVNANGEVTASMDELDMQCT